MTTRIATRPKPQTPVNSPITSSPCFRWDMTVNLKQSELVKLREQLRPDPVSRALSGNTPPDARQWAANLARGIIEILLGVRPVAQIQRWVVQGIYEEIQNSTKTVYCQSNTPPGRRCRISSSHVCAVQPSVIESSVTLTVHGRLRVVAIRLEEYHGRWLATALEII